MLDCSSSHTTVQAICANAMCLCLVRGRKCNTEGVIYSRQRYSLTFLILSQSGLHTVTTHRARESGDYSHLTFDPWITVRITSLVMLVVLYAIKETILGFAV